jgi:aminocarboxymuconate-semialdehyde decarboxylase
MPGHSGLWSRAGVPRLDSVCPGHLGYPAARIRAPELAAARHDRFGAKVNSAGAPGPRGGYVIVDHQTHWCPPEAFALMGRRAERRGDTWYVQIGHGQERSYEPSFYDLQKHIEDMDRHGVGAMLSSPGSLGDLSSLEPAAAIEVAELLNEASGRAQREFEGRFFGLAVLPLRVPDAAVRLLERAMVQHDLRGLCVPPHVAGEAIVSDALLPLYVRLAELGRPLVIHPTARTVMAATYDRFVPQLDVISWMFDTSAAALALIYGGVLDAAPNLVVLHPHLGGALPYIAARIDAVEETRPAGSGPNRTAREYLRQNFYVDSVSGTPGSLRMAMELYGDDRIVFASDHPWLPREPAFRSLRAQLDDARAETIEHSVLPGVA